MLLFDVPGILKNGKEVVWPVEFFFNATPVHCAALYEVVEVKS
jgi:hypothetical protein